jgi:hypothetical protein
MVYEFLTSIAKDFVKTDGHLKDMQTIASFYKGLANYNKYIEEYKKIKQEEFFNLFNSI